MRSIFRDKQVVLACKGAGAMAALGFGGFVVVDATMVLSPNNKWLLVPTSAVRPCRWYETGRTIVHGGKEIEIPQKFVCSGSQNQFVPASERRTDPERVKTFETTEVETTEVAPCRRRLR